MTHYNTKYLLSRLMVSVFGGLFLAYGGKAFVGAKSFDERFCPLASM